MGHTSLYFQLAWYIWVYNLHIFFLYPNRCLNCSDANQLSSLWSYKQVHLHLTYQVCNYWTYIRLDAKWNYAKKFYARSNCSFLSKGRILMVIGVTAALYKAPPLNNWHRPKVENHCFLQRSCIALCVRCSLVLGSI